LLITYLDQAFMATILKDLHLTIILRAIRVNEAIFQKISLFSISLADSFLFDSTAL